MSVYSFEIKSTADLFQKLIEDQKDLLNNPLSSRHAINCAMTAWHLTDWAYIEFKDKHKLTSKEQFRKSLDCPSLSIMHDIANGSKHLLIDRPKSMIQETSIHKGDFDPHDFNFDFDVSCLQIRLSDGNTLILIEELEKVINFWKFYLS